MARTKALLVVFLLGFANTNSPIHGAPVDLEDISEDSDDLYYNIDEDLVKESPVVEGGLEEIKDGLASLDDNEDKVTSSIEGSKDSKDTDDQADHSSIDKDGQSKHNFISKGLKAEDKGSIINGQGYSVSTYSDDGHTSQVTIDSSNVHDVIEGMTSTSTTMMDNRLLVGDDNKMIWSEKPGEVVVVEGSKCTRRLYQQRSLVSSEPISTPECGQVLEKIQQMKREAKELSERLSKMGDEIAQSVSQSMAKTFYPGFPFGRLNGNNDINNSNMNYNNNGLRYKNNSPFGNDLFFAPINSLLGNNWPFGSNNNLFARNSANTDIYGNSGSAGIYDNTGSTGIHGNPVMTGNTGIYGNTAMIVNSGINGNTDSLNHRRRPHRLFSNQSGLGI